MPRRSLVLLPLVGSAIVEGDSCEIAAAIPIARRARSWREAGFDVLLCRVHVAEASATLDVIPGAR